MGAGIGGVRPHQLFSLVSRSFWRSLSKYLVPFRLQGTRQVAYFVFSSKGLLGDLVHPGIDLKDVRPDQPVPAITAHARAPCITLWRGKGLCSCHDRPLPAVECDACLIRNASDQQKPTDRRGLCDLQDFDGGRMAGPREISADPIKQVGCPHDLEFTGHHVEGKWRMV